MKAHGSKGSPNRAQELAYRRARLQAQCAIQRRDLGAAAAKLEYELSGIDRTVLLMRRVANKPAMISAGVALLTLIGPKRALKWASQGAFWYTTGKRVLSLVNSQPMLGEALQSVVRNLQLKESGRPSVVRNGSVPQKIESPRID